MKAWFESLSPRDRSALVLLVAAVSAWLLFQSVLKPLSDARSQMAINNAAAIQALARIDVKVSQLIAARAESGKAPADLSGQLNRAAAAIGLRVKRLQPNSRGEVQVRFESVNYDDLIRWAYQIEQQSLVVVEASITQAGSAGGVNANVRVARGG